MYPAYDAFETFLFVPDHTTHSGSHIRDAVDLKRTMAFVVIALIPCIIFGMWNIGDQYFSAISESTNFLKNLTFGFWKFLPLLIVMLCTQDTIFKLGPLITRIWKIFIDR